jgi:uncharacterized protein YjbI with pentapeptide repeats
MSETTADQPANGWGQPISEERQLELKLLADRQQEWVAKPEQERGNSVFSGVYLAGADVFWLAAYALTGDEGDITSVVERSRIESFDNLSNLHLEGANLSYARLGGAHLRASHLEGAHLEATHLEVATLREAHLEGAYLFQAHLETVLKG